MAAICFGLNVLICVTMNGFFSFDIQNDEAAEENILKLWEYVDSAHMVWCQEIGILCVWPARNDIQMSAIHHKLVNHVNKTKIPE